MGHRFDNFFEYQKDLVRATVLPFFREYNIDLNGLRVADIGCGEGGMIAILRETFPQANLTGYDLSPKHIAKASLRNILNARFEVYDILEIPRATFDFILFRDVLEYTQNVPRALGNLSALLAPNGTAFVTFPPYLSAYGGHQHIARGSWIKAIPYVHLLPDPIFYFLIRNRRPEEEGRDSFVEGYLEDLRRIRATRVSISGFETNVSKAGFQTMHKGLYFIRPSIAFRYRLPVIKNRLFGRIPFLRELTTSGAEYLLRKT
ncbi:MAG: hypothetical protein A2722_02815 [Candidatus Doudnabacteria bacterium RIFCSPHIGHO2_01_FULL_50_11]|uniref:Methyltransferase domain-containing protein n=1 Tax=Candidatus Doudnabacteria bacterium RIFCSPHIGHO2_01_FULL_50_11 TaxID=1817828 RepID=A0A1F5PHX3_9BACT|nr:MAG: hypothetical protein A2722_02815 [Candidatus Doudnabacteria bacterium RIFCSPHIGHO2_01_FULL_50_11]